VGRRVVSGGPILKAVHLIRGGSCVRDDGIPATQRLVKVDYAFKDKIILLACIIRVIVPEV